MDILATSLVGIALAMDCFAVSLALGTRVTGRLFPAAITVAVLFGVFQGGMTGIGWVLGITVAEYISAFGPWIAFALLAIIGGKMVWEGVQGTEHDSTGPCSIQVFPVIALAIATSIDALAVGASFGLLRLEILSPAIIIGLISFAFSWCGVLLGKRLLDIVGTRIEIIGGIILILIGINIVAGNPFF